MATSCNCQRCLGVTVAILTLVVAVLVGILVWRETRGEESDDKTIDVVINKAYPRYFRTSEQQSRYVQLYEAGFQNRTVVNNTIFKLDACSFSCQSKFRRKRQAQTTDHACCISSVVFDAPPNKTNVFGRMKTLLQLNNIKQYFPEHVCQNSAGCTGCVCMQESSLHTAVVLRSGVTTVDDVDDTEIDFFYFPGCCKCVNN